MDQFTGNLFGFLVQQQVWRLRYYGFYKSLKTAGRLKVIKSTLSPTLAKFFTFAYNLLRIKCLSKNSP